MRKTLPEDTQINMYFLKMISSELGCVIPDGLQITSWSLTDLIIKDIHLRNILIKNLKKEKKKRIKLIEGLKQMELNLGVKPYEN